MIDMHSYALLQVFAAYAECAADLSQLAAETQGQCREVVSTLLHLSLLPQGVGSGDQEGAWNGGDEDEIQPVGAPAVAAWKLLAERLTTRQQGGQTGDGGDDSDAAIEIKGQANCWVSERQAAAVVSLPACQLIESLVLGLLTNWLEWHRNMGLPGALATQSLSPEFLDTLGECLEQCCRVLGCYRCVRRGGVGAGQVCGTCVECLWSCWESYNGVTPKQASKQASWGRTLQCYHAPHACHIVCAALACAWLAATWAC